MVAGAGSDREESRGGGGLFRLLCFALHYMAIELLVWCMFMARAADADGAASARWWNRTKQSHTACT